MGKIDKEKTRKTHVERGENRKRGNWKDTHDNGKREI